MSLNVIKGGYQKDRWMHDPDIDEETLEIFNELFTKIAENERPEAAKYVWKPSKKQPKPTLVKK